MAMGGPRARAQRGMTMVELITYTGIFTVFTGTIVGAELAARRLHRNEAMTLQALHEADRLFAAIAEDCDRATGIVATGGPRATFQGPGGDVRYVLAGNGALMRKDPERTATLATDAGAISFGRPDPRKHPRLLRVWATFRRPLDRGETFERTYERTFLIRNLAGYGNGGL